METSTRAYLERCPRLVLIPSLWPHYEGMGADLRRATRGRRDESNVAISSLVSEMRFADVEEGSDVREH